MIFNIMFVQWIPTSRDVSSPMINGYKFRLNRKAGIKTYWKCATDKCPINAISENDRVTSITPGIHLHENDTAVMIRLRLLELCDYITMKDPFKSGLKIYQSARRIILEEFNHIEGIFSYLNIFEDVKHHIYNKKNEIIPSSNVFNFVIPDEYKKTLLGQENFLAFDDIYEDKRIIGFSDANFCKNIIPPDDLKIYMDGTFYSSPKMFSQLYIMHAFKGNKCFPLIFSFLPDKSQATYERFFNLVQEFFQNVGIVYKPIRFLIDFELSTINAIRVIHPEVTIKGCYFHFSESIYRKIQKFGLANLYRNSYDFKFFVSMISVLPLVPNRSLKEALLLCNTLKPKNNDLVHKLFDYFMNTWFSTNSLFDINIWTHSENIDARTNNNVEGFHSKLNRLLRKAHPNFFEMIRYLKNIQYENEVELKIFLASGRQRPKITKYENAHRRLLRLRGEYTAGNIRLYDFMVECIGAIKIYD